MRILEILREGRDAPLFHATSLKAALDIIQHDRVEARTNQLVDARRGKRIKLAKSEVYGQTYGYEMLGGTPMAGVSLTRSYDFATSWLRSSVIFVFDQHKLANHHQMIPLDHTNNGRYDYEALGFEHMEQAEEFVVGPITPVSRCLRSINVTLQGLDRVGLEQFVDERALWGNPLLNRWYPTKYRGWYHRGHYEDEYDGGAYLSKLYRQMRKQGKSVQEIITHMREMSDVEKAVSRHGDDEN